MMAEIIEQQERLIQDIWGDQCIECDCEEKPIIHFYSIKSEDIAILCCPNCEFTIVVVEIDKLQSDVLKSELEENTRKIIATHSALQ